MQSYSKKFILTICAIASLGFLSGVAGELWVNSFLLPSPYLSFKNYNDLTNQIDELLKGREQVSKLSERDLAVAETVQKIRPAIAAVYRYKKFVKNEFNTLTEKDFLGDAAIITNDGWILASSSIIANEKPNYFIVTNDHKIFGAQSVFRDSRLGVAFLKIEANNLPVVSFGARRNLSAGQSAFLFGRDGDVFMSAIKNAQYSTRKNFNDLVRSSENFYKSVFLQEPVADEFVGAPASTIDGKIFGIVKNKGGEIIPFEHFAEAMKAQVKEEEWKQPYLGITFYDLNEVLNPLEAESRGVMVKTVKPDSPAAPVLMPQDIILKIETDELNAKNSLPEILAIYKPETTLKFVILRADKEMQLNINLAKKMQ